MSSPSPDNISIAAAVWRGEVWSAAQFYVSGSKLRLLCDVPDRKMESRAVGHTEKSSEARFSSGQTQNRLACGKKGECL